MSAAATAPGSSSSDAPPVEVPQLSPQEELRCINTVRLLAVDMVDAAQAGHPGAPLGCAPIAHLLWSRFMRYNPQNPAWFNRDRFVLSNGHACALLYSMLHLTGYDMPMDQLKQFRQVGSVTAGHPENVLHPAIEVSTGPLGQGIANAVGLAIASQHLAAHFNRDGYNVVDNYTYCLTGDGCLQEGISSEACSLAGHLGLGRLIVLYDDNKITIDGKTELSFTENVMERFEAYGWHVMHVADGNTDIEGIDAAIREAQRVTDRPSLIKVSTVIGYGSAKAGTAEVHGAPLSNDAVQELKRKFGWDPEVSFFVPDEVYKFYETVGARGARNELAWDQLVSDYEATHPELAAEFLRRASRKLPEGWEAKLPTFTSSDKADATRNISGAVLNTLAEAVPDLIGGSADLTPSNKTLLKCSGDFQKDTPHGRYIRFGVREHAMSAIANGLAAYGGCVPYVGTFLNFIGYAAGAVRLSALSRLGVIYVATHDSIGLGEDGPTHQPVEMLAMLRATPHMQTFRPADGNEVVAAYRIALTDRTRPSVLALSRQSLPQLEHSNVEKAMRGGYVVDDSAGMDTTGKPDLILVATGSEVSLAVQAARNLATIATADKRVAVVSLPCWEVFDSQPLAYRQKVFPEGVPVLSIEALSTLGWSRYAHSHIGVDSFGISGKYKEVYAKLGVTVDAVVEKAQRLLEHFGQSTSSSVPQLRVTMPDGL